MYLKHFLFVYISQIKLIGNNYFFGLKNKTVEKSRNKWKKGSGEKSEKMLVEKKDDLTKTNENMLCHRCELGHLIFFLFNFLFFLFIIIYKFIWKGFSMTQLRVGWWLTRWVTHVCVGFWSLAFMLFNHIFFLLFLLVLYILMFTTDIY